MNTTQSSMAGTDSQTSTRSASATSRAPSAPSAHRLPQEPLQPSVPPRAGGKQNFGLALGSVLLLALVAYLGTRYAAYARSWVKTDNAYLAAHIHSISPRVAGTVKEVLVEENQAVAAGAVLARLDPRDLEVHRQQARAEVAQADAQLQEATAHIAQAHAQVSREQAHVTKATNDLLRADSLYNQGSGAISKQELDLARSEAQASEAAWQGAESALDSVAASATAAQAMKQAAEAHLREAELQLSYTEILAPVAGRIGKKNLEIGNHIQPGQAVLALVQTDIWVTANFKETQLGRLSPGRPVQVRIDAFPGHVFSGTVESLAPGSGAQFALLPPENATGNFTKIVQRVPVKIELDRASLGDLDVRLVPGMSATVEVRVND